MVRLLLLSAFAVALSAQAAESLNQIVAIVNGEAVTSVAVERGAKRLRAGDSSLSESAARRLMLRELIDRRLMLQRAEQFGISISDSVVDSRLAELARQYELDGEEGLRLFALEQHGLPTDEFRRSVRDDLIIQSLFYREVYLSTSVGEAELEQFLQAETDIGIKRRYRLGHIVINADGADARQRAEAARDRAAGEEDFAAVAAELSDREFWDLGFKRGGELPDLFAAEAQNLKVGEVGKIIETPSAYHVVKLLGARGGGLRDKVRRVRLGHVFFPTTGEAAAEEAASALRAGELTFSEAVRRHSEDPVSIDKEGDLGWFAEEDVPPYFSAVIDGMEEGGVSAPIESPFGWHILRLDERRTDKLDMRLMRDRAGRLLRERNALARREVWLRNLRADAYVRITDPDLLPPL